MKALPPGKPAAYPTGQGRPGVTALEYGRCALRTFRYFPHYQNFGSVSVGGGNYWADGTCSAECFARPPRPARLSWPFDVRPSPPPHESPNEQCSCGIYGTLTLEHLFSQYPAETRRIVAVIAAQGQTIIGDLGLQTQYARVVAYWLGMGYCYHDYHDYHAYYNDTRRCAAQFRDAKHFSHLARMLVEYGFPVDHTFLCFSRLESAYPLSRYPTTRWRID